MNGRRASSVVGTCLAALALLAVPATASAYEAVTDDGSTITITGLAQKPRDLITVSYDAGSGEYVITHDVYQPAPPSGCRFTTDGPPFTELRCPAAGVTKIAIAAGEDNDKILLGGLIDGSDPNSFAPPDLLSVSADAGPGNDGISTVGDQARSDPFAIASAAGHPVVMSIDMGTGSDGVSIGGGTFDVSYANAGKFTGANGDYTVTLGNGSSHVTAGDGTNSFTLGSGNSKVQVGDGNDTASFGRGNSKFIGGAGVDTVSFKGGNDKFIGGAGDDVAKMGGGHDKAFGGPGDDTLKGGGGVDKLIGGGGFDTLIGGGAGDKCIGGGGGAKEVGCEHGH
jgi:Ca2+-binding RTX toxin-like protein